MKIPLLTRDISHGILRQITENEQTLNIMLKSCQLNGYISMDGILARIQIHTDTHTTCYKFNPKEISNTLRLGRHCLIKILKFVLGFLVQFELSLYLLLRNRKETARSIAGSNNVFTKQISSALSDRFTVSDGGIMFLIDKKV